MFIDVITMYADLKSKKNYTFAPKKKYSSMENWGFIWTMKVCSLVIWTLFLVFLKSQLQQIDMCCICIKIVSRFMCSDSYYLHRFFSFFIAMYYINLFISMCQDTTCSKMVCPGNISALDITEDGCYIVAAIAEKIYIWQVNAMTCLILYGLV